VAEAVRVKQADEEVELVGFALVWRPGEQQQRVGVVRDGLADAVALGAFHRVVARPSGGQVVGLVEYGDIPFGFEVVERVDRRDSV